MIITHKLCTDLQNRTIQSRLNMVQCDRNSRAIEISLTNDGVDWDVQSLDNVFFRYRKSDGTGGSYDSMKVWYLDFKLRLLKNSGIFFPAVYSSSLYRY